MKVSLVIAACVLLLALLSCGPVTATTPIVPPQPVKKATGVVPTPSKTQQPQPLQPTAREETPITTVDVPTVSPLNEWPSPVPQPAAPARLTPGNHIQLDEITMVSRNNGWGIRGAYLLTTADGGQTWREVTPDVGQVDKIYGAFLDSQHAWIVFSYGGRIGSTLNVYYTSDGGRTWTYNWGPPIRPQVNGDSTWVEFAVLDARNIWVMVRGVYVGAGTHFSHELYHTADGGNTWNSLDSQFSDDYTGMVFADAQNGLRTLQTTGAYAPAPPAYEITTNGGTSWEARELPAPPDAPGLFNDYPYCETYQPALLSARSIRMLVGCFDEHYPPGRFVSYFYSSEDGRAWTAVRLPDKVLGWKDRLIISGKDHALILGRELYGSTDGGNTWSDIATVNWDAQFSFVSPGYIWAVASANGEIALVQSTDGGSTWSEVNPTVSE